VFHGKRIALGLVSAAALASAVSGCAWTREYRTAVRVERALAAGQQALDTGNAEAARRDFQAATAASPGSADVPARIGLIYEQARRAREAILHLRRAISRDPNQPYTIYLALVLQYDALGDHRTADEVLARVLPRLPADPELLNELAYPWADRGLHLEAARKMLERAVRLRPNDGMIVDSLGWAQYRLHLLGPAEETLRRANALARDATITYHLGVVYQAEGKLDLARAQYRQALQIDRSFDAAREALEAMDHRSGD
jgi:tetratricopeptide (TPR) repeat protein